MPEQNPTVRGILSVLMAVLTLVVAAPTAAQESRVPSTEEIIKRLAPSLQPREEDLRNNAVQVEGRRPRASSSSSSQSIDLEVNFDYASARLTADARLVLDNVGRALADPALRDSRFRVAGHTDARGSDAYNLDLSKRRARSVADYLMRQHGVAEQRLSVEGYGRSQLLDPQNPESAVNRRVQITNLGS